MELVLFGKGDFLKSVLRRAAHAPTALVQRGLIPVIGAHFPPIVVASIGRVGSTLLRKAVSQARSKQIFGRGTSIFTRLVEKDCWNMGDQNLRSGLIYKTHDFPNEILRESGAKVLFLYGLPSETVMSLARCHRRQGMAWVDRHMNHMHAIGTYEGIFKSDVLRIEEQLNGWFTSHAAPILGLRYETLWENVEIISEFLGMPIALPPKRGRVPHAGLPKDLVQQIQSTYKELDEKFLALPDFFVRNPKDVFHVSDVAPGELIQVEVGSGPL